MKKAGLLALTFSASAHAGLRTEPFVPTPIVIQAKNLPAPNPAGSVDRTARILGVPQDAVLRAPKGFEVQLFAELSNGSPRWMEITPNGELLVTEQVGGEPGARIGLYRIENGRGVRVGTFLDSDPDGEKREGRGAYAAMGMAFVDGAFLLANTNGVFRWPYEKGQQKLAGRGKLIYELPGRGYNQHWTRNLVVDRVRNKLFVSVGSQKDGHENDFQIEALPRAALLEMNFDGSASRVVASGIRNPIGMDIHPLTNELHTTCTERDRLGDALVPDFFTKVVDGGFYGWPYAYISNTKPDPNRKRLGQERPDMVAKTLTPDVLFRAHSSPIGFRFYRGNNFPAPYNRGGFVALRGSWNRSQPVGYEVAFVPFGPDNRPLGHYESFVTGFLPNPNEAKVWGRPAGLFFLPDGTMLFTDEGNRRIYRVVWKG
jgi:glucose/arabinose dehydrogenase